MSADIGTTAPPSATVAAPSGLALTRVRHEGARFRMLQVTRAEQLTPGLVRVTLAGEELAGFQSASFDDHLKVFFPPAGMQKPPRPQVGPAGSVFPAGEPRPAKRDITPRRYEAAAGELRLEFALHEAGPASDWARQAQPGQYLGIGGPRGSMVIPTGFDWHWLIGDESALPAIARRLEELPAAAQALVLIEVADAASELPLACRARHSIRWLHRGTGRHGEALARAVQETALPTAGEGFIWAAGEYSSIRDIRRHLSEQRGVGKQRIRAAAYWRAGQQAVHENFKD